MSSNSDSGKQWKEKAAELVRTCTELIVSHKKIFIPAAALVLVLLAVCIAIFSGKKTGDKEGAEEAQAQKETAEVTPAAEVPLGENAVAPINEMMERYYKALADYDEETLRQINLYLKDSDALTIKKKSDYIERYDNIICYTKPGMVENSYLVYVYNEAKFYDIETAAPALNTYVVYQNEQGGYYIYEGDIDANEFNYLQELCAQDDIENLCNTVQAKYNEAVAEDEKLGEMMDSFPTQIADEVSLAMAQEQIGQSGASEDESAAQDESETQETPAQEEDTVKGKVTEVETTDTVNVRSSDSELADKLGKAEKGTRLPLIEKRENGWSKIEFEGQEAFIKSEYLQDIVNIVEGQESAQNGEAAQTEPETQTGSESTGNTAGSVGADGKVTAKTTVNVRASASENGERLGVIYKGEQLECIMEQADGWCKVKYKGKTGYVKTEFVE